MAGGRHQGLTCICLMRIRWAGPAADDLLSLRDFLSHQPVTAVKETQLAQWRVAYIYRRSTTRVDLMLTEEKPGVPQVSRFSRPGIPVCVYLRFLAACGR